MKLITNPIMACTIGYRAILECEFAAPVLRGRPTAVTVGDDCHHVLMIPPAFQGWAIARLIAPSTAVLVREADGAERQTLLEQWPQVTMQLCHADSTGVLAVTLSGAMPASPVRVHLCDETVRDADRVIARFDGRQYWFDRVVARRSRTAQVNSSPLPRVLPDLCATTFASRIDLAHELVR